MATWRVVLVCAVLPVAAACSDDGGAEADPATTTTTVTERSTTTTTTAPERPASTTTTAFDPASVEGQVEAAYLRSWDVYAEAVYTLTLDEAALAEVYADQTLENKVTEIRDRIDKGRAALVRVEHNYQIAFADELTAHVLDQIVNHQVLIDPATKKPVEPDPNESIAFNFRLSKTSGEWRVTLIERVNS